MFVDVSPLFPPLHTLLLFLHEHDDWFPHIIGAQLLFGSKTRESRATSSVSSMECAGLRNTATDRAPLLSMSDQVQDMNEKPGLFVAGPAVVMVLSRTCLPEDSELNETVAGLLRRHCGLATLLGQRVSSRNSMPSLATGMICRCGWVCWSAGMPRASTFSSLLPVRCAVQNWSFSSTA